MLLPLQLNLEDAGSPPATAPTIITTSFSNGRVGQPYNRALVVFGDDPKTFAVIAGTLPGGLTLDGSTGVISGTPTTVEVQAGVEIEATNAAGSDSAIFTFTILAAQSGGSLSGGGMGGGSVGDADVSEGSEVSGP